MRAKAKQKQKIRSTECTIRQYSYCAVYMSEHTHIHGFMLTKNTPQHDIHAAINRAGLATRQPSISSVENWVHNNNYLLPAPKHTLLVHPRWREAHPKMPSHSAPLPQPSAISLYRALFWHRCHGKHGTHTKHVLTVRGRMSGTCALYNTGSCYWWNKFRQESLYCWRYKTGLSEALEEGSGRVTQYHYSHPPGYFLVPSYVHTASGQWLKSCCFHHCWNSSITAMEKSSGSRCNYSLPPSNWVKYSGSTTERLLKTNFGKFQPKVDFPMAICGLFSITSVCACNRRCTHTRLVTHILFERGVRVCYMYILYVLYPEFRVTGTLCDWGARIREGWVCQHQKQPSQGLSTYFLALVLFG